MSKESELLLTERSIREVTGRSYHIDLAALDEQSLVELRRMVRDIEIKLSDLKKKRRPVQV